jgi:transposase
MDIHSKIIVCTSLDEDGRITRKDSFENSFDRLEAYLSHFSKGDKFVMESTGFYEPLYDFIESRGFNVILANPLKIRLIAESRMKNDDIDSEVLAKLLRNDWIPESYVPRKEIREMRRIVRTRIQLKRDLTRMKNRIHFELLRLHVDYEVNPFTWKGKVFLMNLSNPRILSYLTVMDSLESEIRKIDSSLASYVGVEGIKNLQSVPGIGLFSAMVIYSEIGDINRFGDSGKLISYAGMIPSVRQSSDIIHHGRITYQGSRYLRWIVVEALHTHMVNDPGSSISSFYKHLSKGKGKSKAIIAASNKLLKAIYWILKENRPYYSKNQAQ